MIVVDTSAIIAIANNEPQSSACIDVLSRRTVVLMSAGTLTELLIVAARRKLVEEVEAILLG